MTTIMCAGERMTIEEFDRMVLSQLRSDVAENPRSIPRRHIWVSHFTVTRRIYRRVTGIQFDRVKDALRRLRKAGKVRAENRTSNYWQPIRKGKS